MGSLFDNPNDEDQTNQTPEDGISPSDLISLPPPQITIVRLILGRHEMSYTQIYETVEESADPLSRAELDETLKMLLEQHWLICDEPAVYRVNLRRKSAAPLNSVGSRRRSDAMQGLWNTLNFDADSASPTDNTPDTGKPGETDQTP